MLPAIWSLAPGTRSVTPDNWHLVPETWTLGTSVLNLPFNKCLLKDRQIHNFRIVCSCEVKIAVILWDFKLIESSISFSLKWVRWIFRVSLFHGAQSFYTIFELIVELVIEWKILWRLRHSSSGRNLICTYKLLIMIEFDLTSFKPLSIPEVLGTFPHQLLAPCVTSPIYSVLIAILFTTLTLLCLAIWISTRILNCDLLFF